MYRVKDWDSLYENNRSRDVGELEWVPFKNQHDGDGITELLDHENGMAHFGAWVLLVQVASKCGKPAGKCGPGETPRGTLRRDNGKPHDIRSIARMSGGKLEVFEAAIPRFLDIGWLEEVPDLPMTYEKPQADAVSPQVPAAIPQEGDDRARGRVPFSSLPFSPEGGPGETMPPSGFRPEVRSQEAVGLAAQHRMAQPPPPIDNTRVQRVASLYPSKASKDGRPIGFTLHAQNLLAARMARSPEYPWEEHAELMNRNPTPPDGLKWVEDMPNPVALEKLRRAAAPPETTRRRL
jgi:hypothetical protein